MSRAICTKSGISFDIQHFPYYFDEGTLHHPVFDLSYEQLSARPLLEKWLSRQFTEIDTKLYFLALLHSSGLVEWQTYARPTLSVCEMNMEALLDILDWKHTIKHPRLSMPRMAITQDTATLDNVRNWISTWNAAKEDFENGYKELTRNQLLLRKEDTLQRLIKDRQKELHQFASMLADWATICAEFPTFPVTVNDVVLPLADYWKQILITCGKTPDHIWRLELSDMEELLTHLEDNLEHGSIYAHATMKLIREGIATHKNYLGNFDYSVTILNNNKDIEQANLRILADNAPAEMPIPHNYPNRILYLKDKIRYEQAQKLRKLNGVTKL